MNHSRCWANDNGTRSGRGRAASGSRAGPARSSRTASPAGVGASNTARTGTSAPSTARIRDDQPHRQQRMPAQGEEVIVRPDPLHAQHLGEQAAQHLLGHGGRVPARRRRPRTPGPAARPRSSFPLGVSGSDSSTTTADGTMYSGSRAAAYSRTAAASRQLRPSCVAGAVRRDHVPGQPLVTGDVLAGGHRGPRHPRTARQHRLDLAGLDPEPADLNLVIGPPGRTPATRPAATGPGPRSGTSAPRAGPNGQARTAHRSAPPGPGSRGPACTPATYSSPPPPAGTGHSQAPARTPGYWPPASRPAGAAIGSAARGGRPYRRLGRPVQVLTSSGTAQLPSASLSGSASPPTRARRPVTVCSCPGSTPASSAGVACMIVAPDRRINPASSTGSSHSLAIGDQHARPGQQRQVQLQHVDVERNGGDRQHPVPGPHREPPGHRGQEFANPAWVTVTPLGCPVDPEV